jgi:hypothetical protein
MRFMCWKTGRDSTAKWKNDLVDWTLVSKEMADLMLKESELALQGTITSCDAIVSRAEKLVTINISIATALIVYLVGQIQISKGFNILLYNQYAVAAIVCLIASFLGIIASYPNLKSYTISGVGMEPMNIVNKVYVENGLEEKLRYINMCLSICNNIQNRILINKDIALRKSFRNSINIWLLILFPVYFVIGLIFHLN